MLNFGISITQVNIAVPQHIDIQLYTTDIDTHRVDISIYVHTIR